MSEPSTLAPATLADFDDLGIPQTVNAAQSMTTKAIHEAVVNVIAYLEETSLEAVAGWASAPDGSVGVDSQLGVDVYNEFVGHLGPSRIKLTAVDQEDWSSVDGLTEVLTVAFSKMKAKR